MYNIESKQQANALGANFAMRKIIIRQPGGVDDLFGAFVLEQPAHAFQQHPGLVAYGHVRVSPLSGPPGPWSAQSLVSVAPVSANPGQRKPRPRAMMPRRISRVPPWMEKRGAFIVERAIMELYRSIASSSGSVGNNWRATTGMSCS